MSKSKSVRKILKIMNKAINLEKEVQYEKSLLDSVAIDNFLNRCLSYVEQVNSVAINRGYDSVEKGKAIRVIEDIYKNLQKYKGNERQDYNERREISINTLNDEDQGKYLESATAYSGGGQGFAHVNWNASLLMNTHGKEDERPNPYWKPTNAKPVRSVPKEEWADILDNMEKERLKKSNLTMEEWRNDMEKQKKEVLANV